MSHQILQDDLWHKLRQSTNLKWSLGYGWWLIPGAIIGLLMWIGLLRANFWLAGAI